ncbi:MAG: PHP domain-containing protein [Clostridia bacterium]|nr:PHP domain-containing protein [Clostridia bacterium]
MRRLACDLHVHSCLSPCGDEDMTPCNIAGMAHLNGLDVVALTDHNSSKNCAAFEKACAEYGIIAVSGMELTTSEEIHMVCLFEDSKRAEAFEERVDEYRTRVKNRIEIFGNQRIMGENDEVIGEYPFLLPVATGLSLYEAVELCRSMGGVCYPAHIDRESNGIVAILGSIPAEIDFPVVEIVGDTDCDRRRIVSSDAHRLWELKDSENLVEISDEGDIITALFAHLRGL